jgi:amino acid adenylation domain-containing protein/thioester reductase-like protein
MTIERVLSDRLIETELLVLPVPLDYQRQFRTFQQALVTAELPLNLAIAAFEQYPDETDRLGLFLSLYAAWIYRFSGEREIAVGTAGSQFAPRSLIVSMDHSKSFLDLWKDVRAQMVLTQGANRQQPETFLTLNKKLEQNPSALLNWSFVEHAARIDLSVEYDSSLFNLSTIDRYIQGYFKLLQAVLEDSSVNVGSIPILTEHEQAIYEHLNDTDFQYPAQSTVHRMIEQAAEQYGDRPAISFAERTYTYEAMNAQANQIAHMLLESGLKRGDFVTLFMERSLETIISLLGVMKAGGAYVPVDPDYPEERIRYIISDTRAAYVLTKSQHEPRLRELTGDLGDVKHILRVDNQQQNFSPHNPNISVQPSDLAYVIYTSGSTGQPKGTLLAHEGAVNLGTFIRDKFAITEQDVLTQFATFSFDASVWEMISALYAGAHLVLLTAEERVSADAFAEAIARTKTTLVPAIPTVFFNQLAVRLSTEGFLKLATVRAVMTAGEALYGEQVRAFQTKSQGRISVYNLYGPTECTIGTTYHHISGTIPAKVTHVPIGTPNGNYRVYVVNNELQLCPLNVPGELLISSIGLAKGYLNQPEKTAEAFIPSPFVPGETVYRSGDIVKLLADGTIEYVTRRDSQVKIRGHRIELGAVEDYLAKYPNVQDTAVIAVKEANGQQALAGYYTTKNGVPLPEASLRTFLLSKMPAYYVPKWLIHLAAMPLSPTGKVERKKLAGYKIEQEPEQVIIEASKQPHSAYHKLIAAAWEQHLGKKQFSIDDDFFQIGGDSLAVIQALVHLKPHCQALTIQDLFHYKTMAELAERMEELEKVDRQPGSGRKPAKSGNIVTLHEMPSMKYPGGMLPTSRSEYEGTGALLLTGATGYLGSHLLYELLKKSSNRIVAIVRPSAGMTPAIRLQEVMKRYFGDSLLELMNERVQVLEADLSAPGLGLPSDLWNTLQQQVGTILHAAADVRHFGSPEQFERTNVQGTRHLLELAESRPGVRFHYISTIGIPEDLALSGQWHAVEEADEYAAELQVDNVYTSSKLAAEKLVLAAAERGVAASIYRPANLTCHSVTGRFQSNIDSNAFYRMLKAMLLLGKAPEADWYVDLTPIDYASSAIAELVMQPEAIGHVFHISNPQPLPYSKLIEYVNECGYPVETMEFAAYSNWLLNAGEALSQEARALAMAQLEGDGAKDSDCQYGCDRTLTYLKGTDLQCATPDLAYIQKLIAYAVYVDYFPSSRLRQPKPAEELLKN